MSDEKLPPDEEGYITIPGGSPFGGDAKIKHNPMFDTDEKSCLSNFAMIIPQGPFVEIKPKPISKVDKTLDKLWVPLCKLGLHRYKSHYGSVQYSFGGDATPTVRQEVYKCSCCKKIKTITF